MFGWLFRKKKEVEPVLSQEERFKRICRTAASHPRVIEKFLTAEHIPLTGTPTYWHDRVAAIKVCRELTGFSLKESKILVDQWAYEDSCELTAQDDRGR